MPVTILWQASNVIITIIDDGGGTEKKRLTVVVVVAAAAVVVARCTTSNSPQTGMNYRGRFARTGPELVCRSTDIWKIDPKGRRRQVRRKKGHLANFTTFLYFKITAIDSLCIERLVAFAIQVVISRPFFRWCLQTEQQQLSSSSHYLLSTVCFGNKPRLLPIMMKLQVLLRPL